MSSSRISKILYVFVIHYLQIITIQSFHQVKSESGDYTGAAAALMQKPEPVDVDMYGDGDDDDDDDDDDDMEEIS